MIAGTKYADQTNVKDWIGYVPDGHEVEVRLIVRRDEIDRLIIMTETREIRRVTRK